jgi:large subunit ribosomal protein L9
MKVILLQNVKNVGKKDEIVEVSDGYAQNFLFKKGLAIKYTAGSKNHLDKELQEREEKEQELIKAANIEKEKIEKTKLTFKLKTGKEGKLFGSVSSKQIAQEFAKKDIKIDKKLINITHTIDSLGTHIVEINLHKKVVAKATVVVEEV